MGCCDSLTNTDIHREERSLIKNFCDGAIGHLTLWNNFKLNKFSHDGYIIFTPYKNNFFSIFNSKTSKNDIFQFRNIQKRHF